MDSPPSTCRGTPCGYSRQAGEIRAQAQSFMLVSYRRQLRGKQKEQKIMAEYKVNDAVLNIAQSAREAGQTVNESAAAAYERNVAFVQDRKSTRLNSSHP